MNTDNFTPETAVTETSLLKRVAVFLEDGEFDRADEYCERVLDINVENGEAYLFKLLATLKLKNKNDLYSLDKPFDSLPDYGKIMRFGSEELKRETEKINSSIIKKNEEQKRIRLYENATVKASGESISELTEAYSFFVSEGKTDEAEKCKNKIETLYDSRYNELYLDAKQKEQEINDRQYRNSADALEKEGYDSYIKENRDKKLFDYSLLVAGGVILFGFFLVFLSVSNYLSLAGISFRTVLRCVFTRIVPGTPLSVLSGLISFRICKKLIKKQRANLIEDIGTAAERAKEISDKINSAENEAFILKRELDEKLDALRKLNNEYDLFVAEKDKK